MGFLAAIIAMQQMAQSRRRMEEMDEFNKIASSDEPEDDDPDLCEHGGNYWLCEQCFPKD